METGNIAYYGRLLGGAWRLLWPVVRQVFGWVFILLGLLGLVLPILQGVLFLAIGIALVGRRNWLIRRATLIFKRFLRRWAAVRTPVIGAAGRMALRAQRQLSRQGRHLHRRFDAWVQRRAARRKHLSSDDTQESRYERASKRV